MACRILVHGLCDLISWPEIELTPPAAEVWHPNHWTARKFPHFKIIQTDKVVSIGCKKLIFDYSLWLFPNSLSKVINLKFVSFPSSESISCPHTYTLLPKRLLAGHMAAAAAAKSHQSCPTLCDPIDGSPQGSPVPGILLARTLEWVAISFSNAWKWKWSHSVMSDPQWSHGLQPTRLLRPWDFPGKSTGVGCHCLLIHGYLGRKYISQPLLQLGVAMELGSGNWGVTKIYMRLWGNDLLREEGVLLWMPSSFLLVRTLK